MHVYALPSSNLGDHTRALTHTHTHTKWWAQARMTHPPVWPVGFRLIRWLTGCTRPDLAYNIVATHVCTRKCTFDIIFLAHVSSTRVPRLLRGDLIANRFPPPSRPPSNPRWGRRWRLASLLLPLPPLRTCMQRLYIYTWGYFCKGSANDLANFRG